MKLFWGLVSLFFIVGTATAGDYIIGAGDKLDVAVWGVESLSVSVVVRPDGKITIPAAGDLAAEGRTSVELSKELTGILSKYVKAPVVTVTVSTMTNNRVYISGGGIPARVLNLPRRTTLFKVLTTLGGVENTDLRQAYLLRDNQQIKKDFYSLFREGDFSQDVALEPEDILFIPSNENNKIYVTGAVKNPKFLIYREGMKILDAVLDAGGLTEYAKGNRVQVSRRDGSSKTIRLKDLMEGEDPGQNIELKAGDHIIIYEGIF